MTILRKRLREPGISQAVIQKKTMHLIERKYSEKWFASDEQFNRLYPLSIQAHAQRHWTPLHVARRAAMFLGMQKNDRIADIGSGTGKFCLAAAYYTPDALFFGIEHRKNLVRYSDSANEILRLKNVSFIHGNFAQLDFGNYDHFYFYNSFYEHLSRADRIGDSSDCSRELYTYYVRHLFKQLEQKPTGTRLATFYSLEEEMPKGFHLAGAEMNGLLKFWVKSDLTIVK